MLFRSWSYSGSLKKHVDEAMAGLPNYKSASIGIEETPDYSGGIWNPPSLTDDDRNDQIKRAIRHLMGGKESLAEESVLTSI